MLTLEGRTSIVGPHKYSNMNTHAVQVAVGLTLTRILVWFLCFKYFMKSPVFPKIKSPVSSSSSSSQVFCCACTFSFISKSAATRSSLFRCWMNQHRKRGKEVEGVCLRLGVGIWTTSRSRPRKRKQLRGWVTLERYTMFTTWCTSPWNWNSHQGSEIHYTLKGVLNVDLRSNWGKLWPKERLCKYYGLCANAISVLQHLCHFSVEQ